MPGHLPRVQPGTINSSNEFVKQEYTTSGAAEVNPTLLAGEDQTNDVQVVEQGRHYLEACPVSAATVLGGTGAAGDYLAMFNVVVTAADATSLVTLNDGGGTEITIVPASAPVGPYSFPLNIVSGTGAWTVTTLAGATVVATGRFTA